MSFSVKYKNESALGVGAPRQVAKRAEGIQRTALRPACECRRCGSVCVPEPPVLPPRKNLITPGILPYRMTFGRIFQLVLPVFCRSSARPSRTAVFNAVFLCCNFCLLREALRLIARGNTLANAVRCRLRAWRPRFAAPRFFAGRGASSLVMLLPHRGFRRAGKSHEAVNDMTCGLGNRSDYGLKLFRAYKSMPVLG